MNGHNKRRKATSVLIFDFYTLYTKFPSNKLLMVLNNLIDFCFDGGECKYITVDNYGARWVNMQLLIYFLIVISLLALRSSFRLLVFL